MTLSTYHQKYANQTDDEIKSKADEKRRELTLIFEKIKLKKFKDIAKIAVIGCADKRLIKFHKEIFANLLGVSPDIYTLDISIDHLAGEENVIKHDCTLPFPIGSFHITYSHVLLPFIETEKQWDLIVNSIDALRVGGFAIHVLDKEEYTSKEPKLPNGLYSVPLEKWKTKLAGRGILYKEIPVKYGLALVVVKK